MLVFSESHPCMQYTFNTQAKIPISEVLLEDLILTLDTDLSNELDYRELAKGMGLWKIEKRENKRKLLSSASFSSSPCKYLQFTIYIIFVFGRVGSNVISRGDLFVCPSDVSFPLFCCDILILLSF